MKMLTLLAAGLCLFFHATFAIASEQYPLTYFLEDEPIYTSSNPARPGILFEVIKHLSDSLNLKPDIQFIDWNEAQEKTKTRPNSIIFPLSRTEAREPHYKWVAKIFDVPVMFISPQGTKIINRYEDAKFVKNIGVIKGTPQERRLIFMKITNRIAVSGKEFYQGLLDGKYQAIYGAKPEAMYAWNQLRSEVSMAKKLQFGDTLQVLPLWIAANKQSTHVDVEAWQEALKKMRKSGAFGEIARKYFGPN